MGDRQKSTKGVSHTLIILLGVIPISLTYSLHNELDLHSAIFNSTYDRDIRPGINRDLPLQIDTTFILKSIKDLEESTGKFSVTGALSVYWIDDRLTWNPSNYGGNLHSIIVPQKKIWIPYILNMHDFGEIEYPGHSELTLRVESNGFVVWNIPNLYESTCDFDLSKYPFDSQTCVLPFYVIGFGRTEVLFNISETNKIANTSIYSENGLWAVTGTQIYTTINELDFQEVRISVSMKRRSAYYISSLILPICFLSFLQLFVFMMPHESGERVGFAVTVLLAVAVYLTLIQDKLPEASQPSVAYLSYKLLVDFITGIFVVVGVIMGLRFYHREEVNVIPRVCQLFHKIMFPGSFLNSLLRRKRKVTDDEKVSSDDVNMEYSTTTWSDVGKATDRFCLSLSCLSFVLCNFVYFIVATS